MKKSWLFRKIVPRCMVNRT